MKGASHDHERLPLVSKCCTNDDLNLVILSKSRLLQQNSSIDLLSEFSMLLKFFVLVSGVVVVDSVKSFAASTSPTSLNFIGVANDSPSDVFALLIPSVLRRLTMFEHSPNSLLGRPLQIIRYR